MKKFFYVETQDGKELLSLNEAESLYISKSSEKFYLEVEIENLKEAISKFRKKQKMNEFKF